MNHLLLIIAASSALLAAVLALAVAFGGPGDLDPMPSINAPFEDVDFSTLPPPNRYSARDGSRLAFRSYPPMGNPVRGAVVLIHGSSASGASMHVLARGIAEAGYRVYVPDIRGHGDSGDKGHIEYIGQLEDDLEDFVASLKPEGPLTLAGFSSGGGYALRVAAGSRRGLFANYLLLAPFLGQDAPTYKADSGGWVSVGVPRILALTILNGIGVRAFNDLTVTRFALDEEARKFLTPHYSFALAQNFRPERDYRASVRALDGPVRVVVGEDDEAFHADRFAEVFETEGKSVPVTRVPGAGHVALVLDPAAIRAAVSALRAMNTP